MTDEDQVVFDTLPPVPADATHGTVSLDEAALRIARQIEGEFARHDAPLNSANLFNGGWEKGMAMDLGREHLTSLVFLPGYAMFGILTSVTQKGNRVGVTISGEDRTTEPEAEVWWGEYPPTTDAGFRTYIRKVVE